MIMLTAQAALKVKDMILESKELGHYLRIGVQHGGCSGFSYEMGLNTEKKEKDIELEQHGVKILVDTDSAPFLQGTVIDYKESMMGGGFSIQNPNASATCGCGISFRTAIDAGKTSEC